VNLVSIPSSARPHLVVAKELGRDYLGIERDSRFTDGCCSDENRKGRGMCGAWTNPFASAAVLRGGARAGRERAGRGRR